MKAILFVLVFSVFGSLGSEYKVVTPALINELADRMRTNHPSLRAEGLLLEAARENVRAVRTWEDPMVMLGGMGAREMMRADDGDIIYGVEQKLPLFGKPGQERKVARAEVEMVREGEEARFQELRRELAKVLFKAALADETVRFLREDLQWLESNYAVAQQQFGVGGMSQVGLLRMQTEVERRRIAIKTQEELGAQALVEVRRAVAEEGLNFGQPLALPQLAGELEEREKIVGIALRFEPKLRVMEQEREAALAQAELTRRKRYPDFAVGAEARNYSGDGSFRQAMVTLSFNVPLGNLSKYNAEYKRELAKVAAIEAKIADEKQEVAREIRDLLSKIAAARREALLYRDVVIPQTEKTFETIQAGWGVNRGMVGELLETKRMLLDARLMYARAVAEQYDMIAELVLCCGLADLEALEMLLKEGK